MGKDHGNQETGVPIPFTRHNDTLGLDAAVFAGRFEFDRHLSPGSERFWAAKLDSVFVNTDIFGGKRDPLAGGRCRKWPEDERGIEFAGAHKCNSTVTHAKRSSIEDLR